MPVLYTQNFIFYRNTHYTSICERKATVPCTSDILRLFAKVECFIRERLPVIYLVVFSSEKCFLQPREDEVLRVKTV